MDIARFRVLLVEDDYLDAHLTKKFLMKSAHAFDLDHVTNGLDAADYLLKRRAFKQAPTPDLVLLDLRLPGMTGKEILQLMYASEALRSIPVIVISGEHRAVRATGPALPDHCPVFMKWLGMKDFQSIVKAVEDVFLEQTQAVNPALAGDAGVAHQAA